MTELEYLQKMMEEMANAPREPVGPRLPGEKGKYEELNETRSINNTKEINH